MDSFWMMPQNPQFISESYVCVPPANHIVDMQGNIWMLGFDFQDSRDAPQGHFSFNVLRNGRETGEYASHIERRNGKVRIFTRNGLWKVWGGAAFV